MEVITPEPSTPETDPPAPRPWICEPETPDVEASRTIWHEDTPTEPGYGHGV